MTAKKSLSPRQREILRYIARGDTDKKIADTIGIKTGTVSNHVSTILDRLNCNSRAHAVYIFFARSP